MTPNMKMSVVASLLAIFYTVLVDFHNHPSVLVLAFSPSPSVVGRVCHIGNNDGACFPRTSAPPPPQSSFSRSDHVTQALGMLKQSQGPHEEEDESCSRNDGNVLYEGVLRRRFIINQIGYGVMAFAAAAPAVISAPRVAAAASATDEPAEPLPTRQAVTETFAPIKFELDDPQGGVSYMQGRIDEQDWDGLMEFTKTYDLELRKKLMGRAKKLLQSKDVKSNATTYANAVTFDLIGINRASRKGQENVESANKYLQELRDDVAKFLSLESTIETLQQ